MACRGIVRPRFWSGGCGRVPLGGPGSAAPRACAALVGIRRCEPVCASRVAEASAACDIKPPVDETRGIARQDSEPDFVGHPLLRCPYASGDHDSTQRERPAASQARSCRGIILDTAHTAWPSAGFDEQPILSSGRLLMSFIKELWAFLRTRKKYWLW